MKRGLPVPQLVEYKIRVIWNQPAASKASTDCVNLHSLWANFFECMKELDFVEVSTTVSCRLIYSLCVPMLIGLKDPNIKRLEKVAGMSGKEERDDIEIIAGLEKWPRAMGVETIHEEESPYAPL